MGILGLISGFVFLNHPNLAIDMESYSKMDTYLIAERDSPCIPDLDIHYCYMCHGLRNGILHNFFKSSNFKDSENHLKDLRDSYTGSVMSSILTDCTDDDLKRIVESMIRKHNK